MNANRINKTVDARAGLAVSSAVSKLWRSKVFTRILVAVDGSEQSTVAAALAGALARDLGARIKQHHAFCVERGLGPDLGLPRPDLMDEARRNARGLVEHVVSQMPGDLDVETAVTEGDAATEILAAATRFGADLIILGTHGRGRIAQAVLGSVSNEVTRKAMCPVLTLSHAASRLVGLPAASPDYAEPVYSCPRDPS